MGETLNTHEKGNNANTVLGVCALDKISSRIKYYLLDWKDENMNEYLRKYGEIRLHDLTLTQLRGLFYYATTKDGILLANDAF